MNKKNAMEILKLVKNNIEIIESACRIFSAYYKKENIQPK